MKRLLVSVILLFIICVAASVVSANMTSGVFESTASCVAAAPTKDFLLGKTHYEKDTNLKADDLSQKRMTFYWGGFNFNEGSIL